MVETGAYRDEQVTVEPAGSGSLDGLEFAVKDVFHIKGYTSSAGNPDWLRTHAAAERHAEAVRLLLEQGARLRGTTHTDELMYSLNGINHHYGTPVNPKAPGRIPGGSSSGSASAVASASADFALGTDTGGSVRIPSSFCGIYGIRPTHGAVSLEGVIPLAPSFDTVGWMAPSAELLHRIGKVLLGGGASESGFQNVYIPTDVWSLAYPETRERLEPLAKKIADSAESCGNVVLSDEGLEDWMNAFRVLQGLEIWQTHGEWIRSVQPKFGPGIAERFAWASRLVRDEHSEAFAIRQRVRERLEQVLGEDGVLVLPTAPGPAPLLQMSMDELEIFRNRMLTINCIAGLSGCPQVHLPIIAPDYPPIGLSVIAARGQDSRLLAFAEKLAGELQITM